jgi:hypothetical protein
VRLDRAVATDRIFGVEPVEAMSDEGERDQLGLSLRTVVVRTSAMGSRRGDRVRDEARNSDSR